MLSSLLSEGTIQSEKWHRAPTYGDLDKWKMDITKYKEELAEYSIQEKLLSLEEQKLILEKSLSKINQELIETQAT